MLSLVAALILLAPEIPPECQAPPTREVSKLAGLAQSSGSLSVGLDSVATWCFDSGGTWTGGHSAKGKKPAGSEPTGDCAKAIVACEAARASIAPEVKQLLYDTLADIERPFLGVKYKPKRSGLAERPPEAAECSARDRSTLFTHAQSRMDLARLASQAQSEYANYKTWLFAEGLKCAQAIARGEKDYTRRGIAVDTPTPGGGTQQVPSNNNNNNSLSPTGERVGVRGNASGSTNTTVAIDNGGSTPPGTNGGTTTGTTGGATARVNGGGTGSGGTTSGVNGGTGSGGTTASVNGGTGSGGTTSGVNGGTGSGGTTASVNGGTGVGGTTSGVNGSNGTGGTTAGVNGSNGSGGTTAGVNGSNGTGGTTAGVNGSNGSGGTTAGVNGSNGSGGTTAGVNGGTGSGGTTARVNESTGNGGTTAGVNGGLGTGGTTAGVNGGTGNGGTTASVNSGAGNGGTTAGVNGGLGTGGTTAGVNGSTGTGGTTAGVSGGTGSGGTTSGANGGTGFGGTTAGVNGAPNPGGKATTPGTTTTSGTTGSGIPLGGPTAERERALNAGILVKWRYFLSEQNKLEQDPDWVGGFLASRELRDCRCVQRPIPSEIVRRLETKDRVPQLEADDDKNTRCELCLLDAYPAWKVRAQKQCALALELSEFELGYLQRSDDGNGLPPRCVEAARAKQGSKPVAGVQVAPQGKGATGNSAFIITKAPDALPPSQGDFVKPSDYAPMPSREDGRVYVRVFTSAACVAEILPGPIQARTGDLLPVPMSARDVTVRGPCGGFVELYFGREEKPRVSDSFARNQPLRIQLRP